MLDDRAHYSAFFGRCDQRLVRRCVALLALQRSVALAAAGPERARQGLRQRAGRGAVGPLRRRRRRTGAPAWPLGARARCQERLRSHLAPSGVASQVLMAAVAPEEVRRKRK